MMHPVDPVKARIQSRDGGPHTHKGCNLLASSVLMVIMKA
ncbi:hypothetical protein PRUPE_3G190700 [Prunus persica]|uniref:Uncharacterized protein n=1 Tax=Prunus persica TaxID=3760 RepID=A0A251Q2C0_PRUPE|nr:hypothetical protein PRUPE_3G190700 [Prunus persica]